MALIQAAHSGGVATITLDSPANRNALSMQLMTELLEALDAAAEDDAVRVVELRHTGPVFCSGADLKETMASAGDSLPVARLGQILDAITTHPKPVLAVVAGPARAGGLGLIAAADLAVCADPATFAFSEVRIGVVPSVISSVVLNRLSTRDAAELFLTGDVFDGVRAQQVGLVTRSVPVELVEETAGKLRDSLVRGGPEAVRATKRLLRERPADYAVLTELSLRHFLSAEGREGVAASREKRDPAWIQGS
jgi:methylglutaconyl-CoA hydratase